MMSQRAFYTCNETVPINSLPVASSIALVAVVQSLLDDRSLDDINANTAGTKMLFSDGVLKGEAGGVDAHSSVHENVLWIQGNDVGLRPVAQRNAGILSDRVEAGR